MSRNLSHFPGFILLFHLFLAACIPAQALQQVNIPVPDPSPMTTQNHNSLNVSVPVASLTPTPNRNLINTPAAAASPTIISNRSSLCIAKIGSLDTGVISTPLLDKPMRYTVYLPPCYFFDRNKRYPVLYLLHGQGFSEDQWIRIGAVSIADQLLVSGEIPPFIIVFPFDYSFKQPTEYKFEQVFTQLLIPEIDHNYRTQAIASHRAIGGLSRGGAWALHIGISSPGLFGAIGGHSPAIFLVDDKALRRNLLTIPVSQVPRIWLDAGDSDSEYTVILRFEEFLSKNNIPHEWHTYIGWHDEKYWSAHVKSYLIWYAQDWR